MTDAALLAAINASTTAQGQANIGNDSGVAVTINAGQPQPVPVTFSALANAAPLTLKALGGPTNLEPIAARLRAGDNPGIQAWADILYALGTMAATEHAAVTPLVNAASVPVPNVNQSDVSRVLAQYRTGADGVARAQPLNWSIV